MISPYYHFRFERCRFKNRYQASMFWKKFLFLVNSHHKIRGHCHCDFRGSSLKDVKIGFPALMLSSQVN